MDFFNTLNLENTNIKKKFFIDSFGYLLYFLNKVVFSKEVYPSKLKIFIWDKIFIPITYLVDFFSFYKLGKNIVCKNGQISRKINTKQLNRYMKQKVIKINVDLGLGKSSKTVLGNDLTYEYLQINADYRS